jgi:hypothetical protein
MEAMAMVSSPQQNHDEMWSEQSNIFPLPDNDYEPPEPLLYLNPGDPTEIDLDSAIEWAIRQSREVPGSIEFEYYQGFDDFEGTIQLLEGCREMVVQHSNMALDCLNEVEELVKTDGSAAAQVRLAGQAMGHFGRVQALFDSNLPVPPLLGVAKTLPIAATRHQRFRGLPSADQIHRNSQSIRNYLRSESEGYRIPRWWDYYEAWEGLWFWWAFGWFLWLWGYRSPAVRRRLFFQHLASLRSAIVEYQIAIDGYFDDHLCDLAYRKVYDEPIEP